MILRNIKTDFRKILSGYGFYLCIIFTCLLCFAAYIYEDGVTGNKYSVFRSLLTFDRQLMLDDTMFCSFEVVRNGAGNWLFLFVPIIASFAFVPLVCDEHEAKSVRFEVFRTNRFCYYTSRFMTGCLCGGLAVMIGFIIFVLVVHALFPSINAYSPELQTQYKEMMAAIHIQISGTHYIQTIMVKVGGMFLYGMFWAAPIMMMTALIRNKYLVMCIPFFIKYGINQTCEKIRWRMLEDPEKVSTWLRRMTAFLDPDQLTDLAGSGSQIGEVLLYHGLLVLFFYIVYLVVQSRRVDCGE